MTVLAFAPDATEMGLNFGGNSLVLRAILGREPRSVADYVAELGRA